MDVLVSLGTNASYAYSIISILHHHLRRHHVTGAYRPTDFFETAAMLARPAGLSGTRGRRCPRGARCVVAVQSKACLAGARCGGCVWALSLSVLIGSAGREEHRRGVRAV
jgi:hypothetical protein